MVCGPTSCLFIYLFLFLFDFYLSELDKCCYQRVIEMLGTSSTQVRSIEIYDFRNLRSEIWSMMTWMIRVSLFTTLVIYKTYFKSHQVRKQRLRTYILFEKLLCLCALGFLMRDTIYYLIIIIYYFWYFYVKNVILGLGNLFPYF